MKGIIMKRLICLVTLLCIAQCAYADYWNRPETSQNAYDRQSQRNYETYRNNHYQAPLGGYSQSFNQPTGRQYGYNDYNNSGISSQYSNNNSFGNGYGGGKF